MAIGASFDGPEAADGVLIFEFMSSEEGRLRPAVVANIIALMEEAFGQAWEGHGVNVAIELRGSIERGSIRVPIRPRFRSQTKPSVLVKKLRGRCQTKSHKEEFERRVATVVAAATVGGAAAAVGSFMWMVAFGQSGLIDLNTAPTPPHKRDELVEWFAHKPPSLSPFLTVTMIGWEAKRGGVERLWLEMDGQKTLLVDQRLGRVNVGPTPGVAKHRGSTIDEVVAGGIFGFVRMGDEVLPAFAVKTDRELVGVVWASAAPLPWKRSVPVIAYDTNRPKLLTGDELGEVDRWVIVKSSEQWR